MLIYAASVGFYCKNQIFHRPYCFPMQGDYSIEQQKRGRQMLSNAIKENEAYTEGNATINLKIYDTNFKMLDEIYFNL